MRLGYHGLDLSDLGSNIDISKYKRMRKTHIRVLSSEVPESFVEKFEDRETALSELLDAVYGTLDHEDSEDDNPL
jgi:hypothetical protein